jgi:hypothetical protein
MKSGYSLASGGDRPVDSISSDFIRIQCRAVSRGAKNELGARATVGYDEGAAQTICGTLPFS